MESQKESLSNKLLGKGKEHIPNFAFRIMTFIMTIVDVLFGFSKKNFITLGLKSGHNVVDYGCGPARYIKNASQAVGKKGIVYAVDIHPLAIKKVEYKIKKYRLMNVKVILAEGYSTPLPDKIADIIYALDMFHMIENPKELLFEFSRILKSDGYIIIEDGHQPRAETIRKIEGTGLFNVFEENRSHVKCQQI